MWSEVEDNRKENASGISENQIFVVLMNINHTLRYLHMANIRKRFKRSPEDRKILSEVL